MSRGFVKEDDLEHAGTDLPERPVSTHPNYVTPAGLQQLQQQGQLADQIWQSYLATKLTPEEARLAWLGTVAGQWPGGHLVALK